MMVTRQQTEEKILERRINDVQELKRRSWSAAAMRVDGLKFEEKILEGSFNHVSQLKGRSPSVASRVENVGKFRTRPRGSQPATMMVQVEIYGQDLCVYSIRCQILEQKILKLRINAVENRKRSWSILSTMFKRKMIDYQPRCTAWAGKGSKAIKG